MAIYNTTFMNNATNIVDLISGLGSSIGSDFLIGNTILFAFATIFLLFSFKENVVVVLLIDGFISTLIAVLLYFAGMIAAATIIYPVVLFILAIVFYFMIK